MLSVLVFIPLYHVLTVVPVNDHTCVEQLQIMFNRKRINDTVEKGKGRDGEGISGRRGKA